ncbi:WD40 repeat-like protein [Aspergillus ellipticus CBS 707.79]|uniref:WD40 repeat-like protein n=1 Tax=Aspergillus ellipticus CBS 707.79 TaxID=1448320 RepID=A0A319DMJ2_9EURO|nr:WD40 repeat-like protein [Aspergillus ellipticus CBS 707.79]
MGFRERLAAWRPHFGSRKKEQGSSDLPGLSEVSVNTIPTVQTTNYDSATPSEAAVAPSEPGQQPSISELSFRTAPATKIKNPDSVAPPLSSEPNQNHIQIPESLIAVSTETLVERAPNDVPYEIGSDDLSTKLAKASIQNQLWEEAFQRLSVSDPDLIENFQHLLLELEPTRPELGRQCPDNSENRQKCLQKLVRERLNSLEDGRLRFTIGGKQIVMKDKVDKAVSTIMSFKDIITTAVSAEPHAALAWGCVTAIVPFLSNTLTQPHDEMGGLEYTAELIVKCRAIEITTALDGKNNIRDNIIDIYTKVLKYQLCVAHHSFRHTISRVLKDSIIAYDWKQLRHDLESAEKKVLKLLSHNVLETINHVVNNLQIKAEEILSEIRQVLTQVQNIAQTQQLDKLEKCRIRYAAFDSHTKKTSQPTYCHPGTRKDILEKIQNWVQNSEGECIFWISGMAGAGKSTIARTAAQMLQDQNCLGASFFFSRSEKARSEIDGFFPTIALDLAESLPRLKVPLSEAVQRHKDIAEKPLSKQWHHLIMEPLAELGDDLKIPLTVVVVIDGVDECSEIESTLDLLELLGTANELRNTQLRLLVTSRPDPKLKVFFKNTPGTLHLDLTLDSTTKTKTEADIELYVRHNLKQISESKTLGDWPGEESIQQLLERSGRLFIAAATMCRFLRETRLPESSLRRLLGGANKINGNPMTKEIDNMYQVILSQAITRNIDRGDFIPLYRPIVGSIILSFARLSISDLSLLTKEPSKNIKALLGGLQSVVSISDSTDYPLGTFHLSFHDFLIDNERCTDDDLFIDEKQAHGYLFDACLNLLSDHLETDICGLKKPGILTSDMEKVEPGLIENHLPRAVKYASCNWVYHLQAAGICPTKGSNVYRFLKEHLLHWLEALALIGKIQDAVTGINTLAQMFNRDINRELYEFIVDARRFILYHNSTIQEAPLQVYSSAILFTPTSSLVRAQFSHESPGWINSPPIVQECWGPSEQTLEGHLKGVECVAISHNGSMIASGSSDGTVRIWNLTTGQCDYQLDGPEYRCIQVAWSSDDSELTSIYDLTNQVWVWNVSTGRASQRSKVDGHSSSILSISPDGTKAASRHFCRGLRAIHIWSTTTGNAVLKIPGHFHTMTFSPDSTKVALGSQEDIQIWDILSQDCQRTISVPSECSIALALSSEGFDLASVSKEGTIRIWSIASEEVKIIESEQNIIGALEFSADGTRLALGSLDIVQMWDFTAGATERVLHGHVTCVKALAFTHDCKRLVSGSTYGRVHTWDLNLRQGGLDSSDPWFSQIATRRGGDKVLALMKDDTLESWALQAGRFEKKLMGMHGWGIIISPDETKAAIRWGTMVQVWDIVDDNFEQVIAGEWESACAFSPDSKKLVLCSKDDKTVQIWNLAHGLNEQTLRNNEQHPTVVALSPDGSKVVMGTYHDTVKIWDASKGVIKYFCQGTSGSATSVMVSQDSTWVASGFQQGAVWLYNVKTEQSWHKPKAHVDEVTSLVFSPSGSRMASGSLDGTAQIWDTFSGQLQIALHSHYDLRSSLSFHANDSWEQTSFYSIDQSCHWVLYKGERVLALPPDFQPGHGKAQIVLEGNTLAVASYSRQLTRIVFDDNPRFDIIGHRSTEAMSETELSDF